MDDPNRKCELKSGHYRSQDLKCLNPYNRYIIDIDLKVTEKSYTFILRDFKTNYGATHIEDLFKLRYDEPKKKVAIKRNERYCQHAIRIYDGYFVFYPYRVGTPYLFEYVED